MMMLAGRAAELEFSQADEVTAGAGGHEQSDFARATKIAIDIETKLGFGTLGVIYLHERILDLALHDDAMIVLVKKRLDRCLARAREIALANKRTVLAVADALVSQSYLDMKEIEALLAKHPPLIPGPPTNSLHTNEPASRVENSSMTPSSDETLSG
jgi:ATP-dependent Zn protease